MIAVLAGLAHAALLCATWVQLGFLHRVVRARAGCLCSKGAISPFCPTFQNHKTDERSPQ